MSDDEGRPIIWSASSLSTYIDCELSWYFEYMLCEPGEQNLKAIRGLAVHTAVEESLGFVVAMAPDPPYVLGGNIPDPFPVFEAAFDAELAKGPVRASKELSIDTARSTGRGAITAYFEQVPLEINVPIMVEADFELEINGIPVSGTIDRIDQGGLARDLKIVGTKPHEKNLKRRHLLQMRIYALGHEVLTGYPATMLVLDNIVANKHPYWWPIYIDPPDKTDLDELAALIDRAAAGVASSRFRPTGLEDAFACYMCPFTRICGPFQRFHAND